MSKSNSILAWFAAIALMALGQAAIAGPDNPGENHEGGDGKDGEGEQTIDHAGRIEFQVIEGNQMRLMWPAGKGRFVVESSDRIGGGTWKTVEIRPIQVSQMMVIDLPLGRDGMQFFRVRN